VHLPAESMPPSPRTLPKFSSFSARGPAAYYVRYPDWIKRIAAFHNHAFEWIRERYIGADMRTGGAERTRHEALYEGRYIERLYGRRLSRWFGVRQFRRLLIARYGPQVKATRERYLELAVRARDRIRDQTQASILFLGLLPMDDEYFPDYTARATEWNRHLAGALRDPERRMDFVDVLTIIDAGWDGLLLSDGQHLTVEGHRRVAALILPTITRLTAEAAASAA
jgi:hypothetical protein